MAAPLRLRADATVPVVPDETFARVLPMPLPSIFDRRYAAFPPVRAVEDQAGVWGEPGQTRTIVLTDGGRMHERLTDVDAPRSFGYELTDLTGPMSLLVARVEGGFDFAPVGTGTRVTWRWTVHPRRLVTSPTMSLFGVMWRRYARLALKRIEQNLLAE